MRDRKGVDLDGRGGKEELWGIEGRKTVISINYRRKKVFLIKRKEKNPTMCG